MTADNEYVAWMSELERRFHSSQTKAALHLNNETLAFYWSLGRDIVAKKAESKWGSGFFNQLSLDLRHVFNGSNGFSVSNLKYMSRWFQFYFDQIRQQPADEIDFAGKNIIRQQPADELEMPGQFALVPWMHHVLIFTKSKSLNEALFYISKTIEGNWSRRMLEDQISSDLFGRAGKAVTNFSNQQPAPQDKLANEILKDPYNFDFLSMRKGYDEHQLEYALVRNITRFLLELGKGFAFVGRQMELKMANGKSFYPDLVFYHTRLKAYVVVELKVVEFLPEFAGKLNFYVTAADELLRGENDNPSIGLLLCKQTDKTLVEWSLRDINKPLGVASYQLQEVVDRTIKELEEQRDDTPQERD